MTKISLVLPDGRVCDSTFGVTAAELGKLLFPDSLMQIPVACLVDGVLCDLSTPLENSGRFEIVTRDDPRALELIRHDTAHILGEAVQELWPETLLAIGPVIENGFYYDFERDEPFTPDDLVIIEQKMHEIIARDKPFLREEWDREKACRVFSEKGEIRKIELIEAIGEEQKLTIYSQGDWFDLCRGPHMVSTGQVGKAFKLMKIAGAYWRGDSRNKMLTRIYGTAWANQDQLDNYLRILEEAEKRDHRRLGREMELFHFQEEAPGVIFWHPKGWRIFQNLISYMRRRLDIDYEEVSAPQVLDRSIWQTSGHWTWYRENMFQVLVAGEEVADPRIFALKPMNCPGHVKIFSHHPKSYRELPVRLAEFGKVHRYEPSGALHGLMRVRGFTQDDAHIFCTPEQLQDECLKINDLILSVYKDFGFQDIVIKLSTRPEKRVGSDESWDLAESVMMEVLEIIRDNSKNFIKTAILPGEGAFYGPKFEYTLKDAIGREWQCGTVQVDFNLPERFSAFYIDSHSEKKEPVMIHRAICGSMERFIGILIEHFSGRLPLWLSPLQAVVATITLDADDYALDIASRLRSCGLHVEMDLRNEKIGYKIREHSSKKVPYIIICGKKEANEKTVSIRKLGSQDQQSMSLEQMLKTLQEEATPPDLLPAEKSQSQNG